MFDIAQWGLGMDGTTPVEFELAEGTVVAHYANGVKMVFEEGKWPLHVRFVGTEGMVYMSSSSASDGTYALTVTFELGVDPTLAQVDVQNRVALAEPQLPPEVRQRGISVRKRSPDMLMVVNLYSPDDQFDGVFLSNYASLNVVPELGRVAGVGEAMIIGALPFTMVMGLMCVALGKALYRDGRREQLQAATRRHFFGHCTMGVGSMALASLMGGQGKAEAVNVLTHCNAGWLATVDWGTALSPIFQAHGSFDPMVPCERGRAAAQERISSSPPCTSRTMARSTIRSKARHTSPMPPRPRSDRIR